MNIYIHKDGTQYGPYTLEQVNEYLQQGSFTPQDQACHDGQNWTPLSQVPGITQPVPVHPVAAPAQTQPGKKSKSKQVQATSPAQPAPATKSKKKIIIWGSVGAVVLIGLIVTLIAIFSGDDDAGTKVSGNASVSEQNEVTTNSESAPSVPAEKKSKKLTLLERIPPDSGAVIFIRVNDLLEKGRDDIAALLPPPPGITPMVKKALEDPASLGIDVSVPLQIHLIPNENTNLSPSGGLAGKLSDKEKFMTTLELLVGLEAPVQKDGYLLYKGLGGANSSDPQIAVGSDFFFVGGTDIPSQREQCIEKFMTADKYDGLLNTDKSFAGFSKEEHDISVWFGGDSIFEKLGSDIEELNLDALKGGSGNLTLNFENGEMVGKINIEAPSNEMIYGKGGFSEGILALAPSDAILAFGFAFDLSKFMEMAEKEILSEFGDEINLDEPMPELGDLTMRDAISAFTGEFLASITDINMPDLTAIGGAPGVPDMDAAKENPFGDVDMDAVDAPFPGPDGPGENPTIEIDPASMLMGAMPKPEFIVAASIDSTKWLKLKAAPPLAMGIGLAMMQGYTIAEKNNFLVIASKDHTEAVASGSVTSPVSGPAKASFKENDFILKMNMAPILELGLPIPSGGPKEMLEGISHLEIASNSGKTQGTGTFRLVLNDKNKNSLGILLQMAKMIMVIEQKSSLLDNGIETEGE